MVEKGFFSEVGTSTDRRLRWRQRVEEVRTDACGAGGTRAQARGALRDGGGGAAEGGGEGFGET